MSAEVTGESSQVTVEFIVVEKCATGLQQEFQNKPCIKTLRFEYTGEYLCYRNQDGPTESGELLGMR